MNKYNGGIIYALMKVIKQTKYILALPQILLNVSTFTKSFLITIQREYVMPQAIVNISSLPVFIYYAMMIVIQIYYLEFFSCSNKSELTKCEGQLIKQYRDVAVNRKIEGRTSKEYSKDNSDILNARSKLYNDLHKDRIKERSSLKTFCICGKLNMHIL